jgi:hypothetical protein
MSSLLGLDVCRRFGEVVPDAPKIASIRLRAR